MSINLEYCPYCNSRHDARYLYCNAPVSEQHKCLSSSTKPPRLVSPPFAALESGDYRWNDETGDLYYLGDNERELLNPDMPSQELRLHMGELTADEVRVARSAIAWANTHIDVEKSGDEK